MDKTTVPMTCDEFRRSVDAGRKCELVRGEVIDVSPGGLEHGRWSARIVFALESWARTARCGRTFTNEVGLITERDPDTLRGADIVYYSYARLPKGTGGGFSKVAPNLVVEVWGQGQSWTELHEKAAEYLRMGADRVWLVAPEQRTVHVLGRDVPPAQFAAGSLLRDDTVLPGLEILVDELFED